MKVNFSFASLEQVASAPHVSSCHMRKNFNATMSAGKFKIVTRLFHFFLSHTHTHTHFYSISTEHWKSDHKVNRLKCLYKGKEARALLELGGVVANDFRPAYDMEAIGRLFEHKARYICMSSPPAIVMCIDPNGGGASEMAICSAYFVASAVVVSTIFPFIIIPQTALRCTLHRKCNC